MKRVAFTLLSSSLMTWSVVSGAATADPTSASAPAMSSAAPAAGVTQAQAPVPSASPSVSPSNSSSSSSPTSVASSQQPAVVASGASAIGDTFLTVRDPFRRPEALVAQQAPKSDLEKYPADAFKYVGLLTGPTKLKAMIVDPGGKTHFVSERARLGSRGGVISLITADLIRVREKQVNLLGQEENLFTDIKMPSTSKQVEIQKSDAPKPGALGASALDGVGGGTGAAPGTGTGPALGSGGGQGAGLGASLGAGLGGGGGGAAVSTDTSGLQNAGAGATTQAMDVQNVQKLLENAAGAK